MFRPAALLAAVSAVVSCALAQTSVHSSNPASSSSTTSVPSSNSASSTTTTTAPASTSADTTNPYYNQAMIPDQYYAHLIQVAAGGLDVGLKAAYYTVAQVPTFQWLDSTAAAATLGGALSMAQSNNLGLQIVVYDMPNRNCRFGTPAGDFTMANNGLQNYQAYIDNIAQQISQWPTVPVIVIIEPNSLANQVAYTQSPDCLPVYQLYQQCVTYALQQLNQSNVHVYIDAGNEGTISTPAMRASLASLLDSVYVNAGSPKAVRGLATNVANYNFYNSSTPDPVSGNNTVYNELLYIQALAPLLQHVPRHFIVDQSRSGVADIRPAGWISYCNLQGAGFGPRPTTNTSSPLVDALVWVKQGGLSDGTTNSSSPNYQPFCDLDGSDSPAPEYDAWFEDMFNRLVVQANPTFFNF